MAATPSPSTTTRSRVPSRRVLRAINPVVSAILRSRFHRLLSDRLVLLTYTGRKTGKRYTIPVGYSREGDTLVVPSAHAWWRSLRWGAPVTVLLQGRQRMARAEVIEDPAAVFAEVERLTARYGRAEAGRRLGLRLATTPPALPGTLAEALHGHVVIRLRLEAGEDRGIA